MKRTDTTGRQLLAARMKSAIVSAAIVGTVGGWVAFAGQQADSAAATATVASLDAAGVSAATGLAADTTSSSTAAAAATASSAVSTTASVSTAAAQPQALATTRTSR